MNRPATAVLTLAFTAIPFLSFAQTAPSSPSESGAMHSMNAMAMPASSAMHGGMILGQLPQTLQGKPLVVRIHADWCPACKATAATFRGIEKHYAGKANFVTFDVTDAKTAAEATTNAQKLGLSKFYDADKTATSTVAIINPKTGAVSASLYNDNSPSDYAKAIETVSTQLRHG
jgi:thiol-disulfide isomerase/thioredoxin